MKQCLYILSCVLVVTIGECEDWETTSETCLAVSVKKSPDVE